MANAMIGRGPVMRWLERQYRRLATGFAFACVFLGGSVIATVMLPPLALFPGDQRRRAQWIIRTAFTFYLLMLRFLRLIRLEVSGGERLRHARGRIIIANHPSLLDVVILMMLTPDAQCIIKHQLWANRYLGALMRRAGYIRNDLEPAELIEACRRSLASGANLIIFPEGSRSAPGSALRFQRGFANIATLTEAAIQPVVITCTPPTLLRGEKWWAVPEVCPVFRVVVPAVVDASSYINYRYRSMASRKLVDRMEEFYAQQLGHA